MNAWRDLLGWCRASLAFTAMAVAGCENGPTSPGAYTHYADGRMWAAVSVPQGTPSVKTWLPYLHARDATSSPVLNHVRRLRSEAEGLRRQGELERAVAVEGRAAELAAGALSRNPPPPVLISALGALSTWMQQASTIADQEAFSGLDESMRTVREARAHATQALQEGDTIAAAVHLTRAAAAVFQQSPEVIAARALTRAEQRLVREGNESPDAVRAVRLLRHARESLATGDAPKALRRALYALQLVENLPVAPHGER